MSNIFQKAERKKARLKLAMTGPSGSGKTYSSLLMASGLGSKIALIDTENESASLYAGVVPFDTLNISPPYTVQKYIEAIKAAVEANYDVLVIDSLTHAWAGEGGLLSKKEALDARGGNSYTNWASITKEHEAFRALILASDIHLIATMRSKQDYVVEQNDRGKSAPRKVGLAPIQRDGMEYEFTTVFDVAMDHNASVSKDRTGLFDGQVFKIGKETGLTLAKWLNSGAPQIHAESRPVALEAKVEPPLTVVSIKPSVASPVKPKASPKVLKPLEKLMEAVETYGWKIEEAKEYMSLAFNVSKSSDLFSSQLDAMIKVITTMSANEALSALDLKKAKPSGVLAPAIETDVPLFGDMT